MQFLLKYIVFILLSVLSNQLVAQTPWLWAESIDRSNSWNEPFYKPYNTADKLLSYRADSAAYCTDCSLTGILWKGIEANKIAIYQPDKKGKIVIQKTASVKTKILSQITLEDRLASLRDVSQLSEIVIYRKPDSIHTKLSELAIEWIALKVPTDTDTISIYLKSKDCFTYLTSNECKWVYPLNHHIKWSMADALIHRDYIIRNFSIVSSSNLKVLAVYKTTLPPLAEKLKQNDTHTSKGTIEYTNDTLLIRLQAIYSADIKSIENRGFYKAHLIDYLLQLYSAKKIIGYTYHEEGYFTPMKSRELSDHLLTVKEEDGELTFRRAALTELTSLHVLKTYTKISSADRVTNDWLMFGLNEDIASTFNNTFAIAFKFEDVLSALSTTNKMWFNGHDEKDSTRLDEALRQQYIDYHISTIYSVYGDTITSFKRNSYKYSVIISDDKLSDSLYNYVTPFFNRDGIQRRSAVKKSNIEVETYQLNYSFISSTNSALTKNTQLIDALLDAIKTNQLVVYSDESLTRSSTAESVLKKLDKTRFYKTGNAKKDSIYISKIPVENRFIHSSELTEFTINSKYTILKKVAYKNGLSNYTILKNKNPNQGFSFGVLIPAELNPQYETDTLCYVSFNEFVSFLQKNKVYKKLSVEFMSLLNERAIVSVEDFYDILLYDAANEDAIVPNDLPAFVRERIQIK